MTDDAPILHDIAYETFLDGVQILASRIDDSGWLPDFIVGIGRGGLVPAVYVSHRLNLPMLSIDHSSKVSGFAEELLGKVAEKSAAGVRLLFIDDINDSGGTIAQIRMLLSRSGCHEDNLRFAVLIDNMSSKVQVDYHAETIDRAHDKRWFIFPWEAMGTKTQIVGDAQSVPERLA